MRKVLIAILLILTVMDTAYPRGQGKIVYASVPFQNVTLNPQDTLQASFGFGNFNQMMCYENFSNIFFIQWPFQGTTQSLSNVSSLFLSRNPAFTGGQIDTNGTLSIQNQLSTALFLNCQFTV